jgi:DNA-directed RNA polymerase omega subunit
MINQHKRNQMQEDRIIGLTSQVAVSMVGNRYDLVLIAAQRARELSSMNQTKSVAQLGSSLTALKEIEQGQVGREYLLKLAKSFKRSRRQ